MMSSRRFTLLLFIIGLFSATQVRIIGSVGISELVMFVLAPFMYIANAALFKRGGTRTFIVLVLMSLLGCVISSAYNDISFDNFLRGFATPYGWLAGFLVFYPLIRKEPQSFSWYLLGVAFSLILNTFMFHNSYEMVESESRGGGAAAIMEGAIYWTGRIDNFIKWPIEGAYMKIPIVYSICAPLAFAIYALISTASGRSQALIAFAGAVLIAFVRKDVSKMHAIRRHAISIAVLAIVFALIFKVAYSYLASGGQLGEAAKAKYESQTRGGSSAFEILREGRGEMFRGLYYCVHRPIMGYGPWAIDKDRLYLDYLAKYGVGEDYLEVMNALCSNSNRHIIVGAHSAMLQFWLAYGILGMPVWLYLFYLIYDYFTKRIGSVPEFFGYFALVLPSILWAIFFSPFGNRLEWSFLMAMLLVNREMSNSRERLRY